MSLFARPSSASQRSLCAKRKRLRETSLAIDHYPGFSFINLSRISLQIIDDYHYLLQNMINFLNFFAQICQMHFGGTMSQIEKSIFVIQRAILVEKKKKGMCLAPLDQHQQTDFMRSYVAGSEGLIARNISNRH